MSAEPSQEEIKKVERHLRRREIKKKFGSWTGFRGKTLWDWMGLIISAAIPIVLLIFGQMYNESQRRSNLEVELDRQREAALQKYFDDMADLIFNRNLAYPEPDPEAVTLAKTRTFTVLRGLDGERKGALVQFLYDARIITRRQSVINLKDADLTGADLSQAILTLANLSEANLRWANLSRTYLRAAKLQETHLEGANLEDSEMAGAELEGAYLDEVNLNHVDLQKAHLEGANLNRAQLEGAILWKAYLMEASLEYASLRGANLSLADLSLAKLYKADLSEADLEGAIVEHEQLAEAYSLEGAIMPDGTLYDGRFDKEDE